MKSERLMKIILAPYVSEKATLIADKNNQYTFKVAHNATKAEIKSAVEFIFNVGVQSVQVLSTKGKKKRFGQFEGRRKDAKKAYVSLVKGAEIDFLGDVKQVGDK